MKTAERNTRLALKISLWLKSFFAVIEMLSGSIFYFASHSYITNFVYLITRDELIEDSKDFFSQYLLSWADGLSVPAQYFIAGYLFLHGAIKMIIIVGLLKDKMWAYPAGISVFLLFIIYQSVHIAFTHSIWIISLTLFDLLIVVLIWREYSFLQNKTPARRLVEWLFKKK